MENRKDTKEMEFYNKSQKEQDVLVDIAIDLDDDNLDITNLKNHEATGLLLVAGHEKAEYSLKRILKTRIICGLVTLASSGVAAGAVAGLFTYFQKRPLFTAAAAAIIALPGLVHSIKNFASAKRIKSILRIPARERVQFIDEQYSSVDDIALDASSVICDAYDQFEDIARDRLFDAVNFDEKNATEEEKANEQDKHENMINEYEYLDEYCDFVTEAAINGVPKPSENSDYPEM